MNRATALATGALLAAAIAVSGCVTPPSPPSGAVFDPDGLLAPDDPRVTALLAGLRNATVERRSLIASARLSLDAPDRRFRRPQRLAVRRPADLRVEILGLFGQIAAILVTDGTRYQLWDGSRRGDSESGLEQGEVSRELLWAVARVDLSPAEAVALLLGVPIPASDLAPVAAAETQDGGVEIALGSDPEVGDQVVEFDRDGRLTRASRRAANGELLWHAEFADYRELDGESFAHEVSIDFPRFDARVALDFDTAELNRELSSEVFVLRLNETAAH